MTDARVFYGWKLLIALSAIVSVNLGVTYVGAGVLNAQMARDLHLSRSTLGLGSTIYILFTGMTAPVAARFVNLIGSRLTICIGSAFTALGALLLATWVSQGWQFVLCYGLIIGMGCGMGALVPAQACTTQWFERKRALALALVLAGSGIGGSIAAPALTRVMTSAGGDWRMGWFAVLGVAVAVGLISALFVRNRPGDIGQQIDGVAAGSAAADHARAAALRPATVYRTREHWTVRQAIRTPALWLISAAAIGESSAATAAVAHAVPHLRDLGHSLTAAAAAFSLFGICSIAGKLSVGFLCDRLEPRFVWVPCIVMMGAAVLVATEAQSTLAMYLFTGLLGFGSGAALTSWHATIANYFGPASFASILGAQMPFNNVMAAAAPFLVGLAYDAQGTYVPAFYVVAAISILAALLLVMAKPPIRRQESAA